MASKKLNKKPSLLTEGMTLLRNIKRACLSVANQPKKSILLALLITTVLTMIMISLSIQKTIEASSKNAKDQMKAEMQIRTNPNHSMTSIEKQDTTTYLNKQTIEAIKRTKGVTNIQATLQTFVKTNNDLNDFSDDMPTNSLYSLDNLVDDSEFSSGKNKLVAGVMPYDSTEKQPILASETYIEENNLHIGDAIQAFGGMSLTKKTTYTISGIFRVRGTEDSEQNIGNPIGNSENNFYTTSDIAEKTMMLDTPKQLASYESAKVTMDKVDNIRDIIATIQKNKHIDKDSFSFKADFEQYDKMTESINNVAKIATIILWIAGVTGTIVLFLVIIMSLRERKFEIGVLLSLGEAKGNVSFQIFTEIFLIFICSFVLAIGVSSVSANTVGQALLTEEVTAPQVKNIEKKPETAKSVQVSPVDSRILGQTFALGLGIMTLSTVPALFFILRKDPKVMMLNQE